MCFVKDLCFDHTAPDLPVYYQLVRLLKLRLESFLQVNLFQKFLFLHQLNHNMTTDCSLHYKFNTWKFQAQTWGEHIVYRNCFWHSRQFLTQHVLPMFCKKKSFWQRFTCTKWTANWDDPCPCTRTTDTQSGNSLHCTAENSIPIPNF